MGVKQLKVGVLDVQLRDCMAWAVMPCSVMPCSGKNSSWNGLTQTRDYCQVQHLIYLFTIHTNSSALTEARWLNYGRWRFSVCVMCYVSVMCVFVCMQRCVCVDQMLVSGTFLIEPRAHHLG